VQLDVSAESDAGVKFGARTRMQTNQNGATAVTDNGLNATRFYAKSGAIEVAVGNILGALESMPGTYPVQIGFSYFGDNTAQGGRDGYSSDGVGAADANGVEVMYAMGDFKAHVSASDRNNRVAAYGAYTMSGWTLALGMQDSDAADDNEYVATVGGSIGGVSVTLAHADNGTDGTRTLLAASFSAGAATTIDAYYADDELVDSSTGIGFHHSLGGGVTLRGGVSDNFDGDTTADFGVNFNF